MIGMKKKSIILRVLMFIVWSIACVIQVKNNDIGMALLYGGISLVFLISLTFSKKSKSK